MRKIKAHVLTLLSLLLCFPTFAKLNLALPTQQNSVSGKHASSFTSTTLETRIGLEILRDIRGRGYLIEDPEINTWVRSIGNRLTANASHSSAPFYFVIARNPSVNAFATQGGVIVINAGLILNSDSESELAAVMAHEIAHVTQNHINRMIEQSNDNRFLTNVAILAGILASSKDPQAGQAIFNAALATSTFKQLSFSRGAEAEADRVGIRILASAGFNPQAMYKFLKKLESFNDTKYQNIQEMLQNHPLTHKRVTDTRIRAEAFGHFKGRENISYLYMREKVRALIGSSLPAPSSLPANIKTYSKALQLEKKGNHKLALTLSGNKSRQRSQAILIAKLLNKQRRFQETIALLAPLLKTYPEDTALTLPLAQAYLSSGKGENAWQIINEINISEQTSLEYFEVKQNVARLTRRTSSAYFASANKNIRIGSYKVAAAQLRRAISSPDADYNNLQQMQRELDKIE